MFLRRRRSVLPSFSAVLQLEVEEKGEERTIVLIHSAAPSPDVLLTRNRTRAKQQEKVGFLSRMSSPCTWLYDLGSLTSKQKRSNYWSCCWWSITWPGAGRCRRTIADVDEHSKKRQLFIFGVPCVRLLSDDEDWDSESRHRSSTQGAAEQTFSHHGTSRPKKISKLFRSKLSRRCNRTE